MGRKRQKKQLKKRRKGLERQKEKHLYKLENLQGRKDTTPEYWRKEVNRFEEDIKDINEKLEE